MLAALFSLDLGLGLLGAGIAPLLLIAGRLARPNLEGGGAGCPAERERGARRRSGVARRADEHQGVRDRRPADRALRRSVPRKRWSVRRRIALLDGLFGAGVQSLCAVGTAGALYLGVAAAQRGTALGRSGSARPALPQSGLRAAQDAGEEMGEPPVAARRAGAGDRPADRGPGGSRARRAAPAPHTGSGRAVFRERPLRLRPAPPDFGERDALPPPPGERVGIVGETGAGKSTLISLLLRLYDPTEGKITLDGVDLRDLSVRDLRSQLAVVFQETVLLPGTLAENIAVGKPDASLKEIEAAARAAQAP